MIKVIREIPMKPGNISYIWKTLGKHEDPNMLQILVDTTSDRAYWCSVYACQIGMSDRE